VGQDIGLSEQCFGLSAAETKHIMELPAILETAFWRRGVIKKRGEEFEGVFIRLPAAATTYAEDHSVLGAQS
jgi:hypothetical protein